MRNTLDNIQNTNCSQTAAAVPCTDSTARDIYLNDPVTREALHVGEDIHQWTFCRYDSSNDTAKITVSKLVWQCACACSHVLVGHSDRMSVLNCNSTCSIPSKVFEDVILSRLVEYWWTSDN